VICFLVTVTWFVGLFLAAVPAVILLAIRLDRYEDELERRFHLRTQGAGGVMAESTAAQARFLTGQLVVLA
jgi:hypothetical protein